MKGSLLNKMRGTTEQKFANLRALYAYMWAHPGKNLLFMGGEFGQWREWTETESLDWHLLEDTLHGGVQKLIQDLNRVYGPENALWESDGEPAGFEWIDVDNAFENILAFIRRSPSTGRELVCVCNFSAVAKKDYSLRLPRKGKWQTVINSDDKVYGGAGSVVEVQDEDVAMIDLPPLSTIWFASQQSTEKKSTRKNKNTGRNK
jgi:1,4-alpha-glucan branching enzyme